MRRYLSILLTALFFLPGPALAGPPQQRQITWQGLSEIIGRKVRIVMPEGSRIEGNVLDVESDALVVDVRNTSNKSLYPKGRFLVPRATLRALEVNHPTYHWRAVGAGLMAIPSFVLVLFAAYVKDAGPRTGLAAGAVALPVIGYLLGRAADRRVTTYVITQ